LCIGGCLLVGANTSGLESLGGELFILVWKSVSYALVFYIFAGCDVLETRWTHVGKSSTPAFFLFRVQFLSFQNSVFIRSLGVLTGRGHKYGSSHCNLVRMAVSNVSSSPSSKLTQVHHG
jgi:hypothetical protein